MAKLAVLGDSDSLERPMVSLSPIAMDGKLNGRSTVISILNGPDAKILAQNAKRSKISDPGRGQPGELGGLPGCSR